MRGGQATYVRALVASGLLCAVSVLWIAMQWGGPYATLVFTNVLHLGTPLLATAFALRRARRADAGEARGWRWLALACWTWAVGQLAWMVHELWFQRGIPLAQRELPFPFASDVGFLLFFPFMVLALLRLPRGLFRLGARLRLAQDATLVALALGLLAWVLFLREQAGRALAEDPLAMAALLAYPVGDVLVLVLAVLVSVHAVPEERGRLRCITLAALVFVAGDAAFFLLAQPGTPYLSVTDVAWPAAFLLLVLGTLAPGSAVGAQPWVLAGPRVAAALAVLALAAAVVALGRAWDPLTAALAAVVTVVLAWRWVHLGVETRRARRIALQLAGA